MSENLKIQMKHYNGESWDNLFPKTSIDLVVDGDSTLENTINSLNVKLENKVEKIEGKTLSTNDFTDQYKNKIDNLTSIPVSENEPELTESNKIWFEVL